MRTHLTLAALLLQLAACASNPSIESLSTAELQKLSDMDVSEQSSDAKHEILGKVKGLSCRRNAKQPERTSYDEAIQGAKIQAIKLNADAITSLSCQENNKADWSNNCWSSIVCLGVAVKYK